MATLAWIIAACLAMSAVALVGLLTFLLPESALRKVMLPRVAFAAGSLLGGAFLHLIPEAAASRGAGALTLGTVLAGFSLFFLLES